MEQLKDRVAVITGSGRGIGKAIALELVRRGAKVVINAMGEQSARATTQEIIDSGGEAIARQADVSSEEGANALIETAIDAFGQIDILVNNAGITRDRLIFQMKPEEFDKVMTVNLRSAWLCSKAAIPHMTRKGAGRIINMGSISGMMGQFGQTNYSASKAAIISFTKTLAKEVGSHGITVNTIAPGYAETELTEDVNPVIINRIQEISALGRLPTLQDIANATAFLASDDATAITGQVLVVDAGVAI